jgi:hypothetical protein
MKLPRLSRALGSLSPRDRRSLVWGASVIVPALLINAVVRPAWSHFQELSVRLERERDLLQREETLLASERQYPVEFRAGEQRLLKEAPRLFPGPDLVAAAAELGTYVNGQAYSHRVMIQRSQPMPSGEDGSGISRIRLEVQGVSDLQGIVSLLRGLETGKKLISVERLAIATTGSPAPGERQESLAFGATVVGYALADSTPPPRDPK